MSLITQDLWAQRNDCGQQFPAVSIGSGLPKVVCRAWGGSAATFQTGAAQLTSREVQDGFQFDLSPTRRLTICKRASLTFPDGTTWTPENGLTYAETICDGKLGVADQSGNNYVFPTSVTLAPGVVFLPQGELTQQDIDAGCIRPAWCVNSLAVYHVDGRKLGHLPRPFISDANGDYVWGVFTWDGSTLVKVFPANAVDALVPPLLIDETFGYTPKGGTAHTGISANYVVLAGPHTAPANGSVTDIAVWVTAPYTDVNITHGWYTDSAGSPDTRKADSAGGNYDNPDQLITQAMDTAEAMVNANDYWFALNSSKSYILYYDAGTKKILYKSQSYSHGSLLATITSPTTWFTSRDYTFYAIYTPSGGGFAGRSKILGGGIAA